MMEFPLRISRTDSKFLNCYPKHSYFYWCILIFAGESLSNLDGLTSGSDSDDGISLEIVTNSVRGSRPQPATDDKNSNSSPLHGPDGKLQFSALLATLQPKTLQQNKGKFWSHWSEYLNGYQMQSPAFLWKAISFSCIGIW